MRLYLQVDESIAEFDALFRMLVMVKCHPWKTTSLYAPGADTELQLCLVCDFQTFIDL